MISIRRIFNANHNQTSAYLLLVSIKITCRAKRENFDFDRKNPQHANRNEMSSYVPLNV